MWEIKRILRTILDKKTVLILDHGVIIAYKIGDEQDTSFFSI